MKKTNDGSTLSASWSKIIRELERREQPSQTRMEFDIAKTLNTREKVARASKCKTCLRACRKHKKSILTSKEKLQTKHANEDAVQSLLHSTANSGDLEPESCTD